MSESIQKKRSQLLESVAPKAIDPPIWVILGKGGSGKSSLAISIISVRRWMDMPVRVASGDPANPTLPRYFPAEFAKYPELAFRGELANLGRWVEQALFGPGSSGVVIVIELGANTEGDFLIWMNRRGASIRHRLRFLIPIDSKDAVTAASRIIENAAGIPVTLVKNEYGGSHADAAVEDSLYKKYVTEGANEATFPVNRDTMHEVHVTSMPPHELLNSENLFTRAGAESMLHDLRAAFANIPELFE